jgi:tRNA threonylcarbamoyl adenosine modification protein YeaZ
VPLILSIESSTPRASLALLRDSKVIYEGGFESDRNHNSMLFVPLQRAVAALGVEKLDAVVIGTGPGSYSGTRVGIAAGQGVAMVHGCPAVGLSSLLAAGITQGTAIGDARRGCAWWADIRSGELPEPELVPNAGLLGKLGGSGELFSFEEVGKLGLPESTLVSSQGPDAVRLGLAWLGLSEGLQEQLRAEIPQPAYLRPPHVTMAKKGHPLLRLGDA